MIQPHLRKRQYEVRAFTEDCEAADWLNEMFDQGYVVDALTSKLIPGRQDRRKSEVQFTIIMRLNLDGSAPLQASEVLTLRDLHIIPEMGARTHCDILGLDNAA